MIKYSDSVVKAFKNDGRALATLADVELGVTYYTNSWSVGREGFQITRLLTNAEHWDTWANQKQLSPESSRHKTDKVAWFEVNDGRGPSWHSLTDCNIDACYNPWVIFRTKEALEEYEREQVITYESDCMDEMFDNALDYERDYEE